MSGPILLVLRLLLASALYAFLGWAFWVLWQDLRRHSKAAVTSQVPTLTLVAQTGDSGTEFRFTLPEILVGRDPACQCCLDDKTISAQHARLSYHHRQWWVEDLRSRNGTFLNQAPVAEPLVIVSGDLLRCGQVIFQVLLEGGDSGV
jgi:pSer/pThr/pTyr-binding forkhead associated (FHA) protein